MSRVVVAIDGPAGAGKSTVARALASRLGLVHIDTGATYRVVGLRALAENVPLDDAAKLGELAERVAALCTLGGDGSLRFDGAPVGEEVRTSAVSDAASRAARYPEVRQPMVALQRSLVPAAGAVVEGRDIGTVVWPDADLKVYLDADADTRTKRRAEHYPQETLERDARDAQRDASPMVAADGAVRIDTTSRAPAEIVEELLARLRSGEARPRGPRHELPEPAYPWIRFLRRPVRLFAATVLRGVFRMRVTGRKRIPRHGAAILAPNHRSLVDIPAVAILTRRKVWCMGKEELFRSKLLGSFFYGLGGFPVRRGRPDRRSLNTALDLLRSGELVVIYPEGTRTPDSRFESIEEGFAYLALKTGAPVVPIALSGTESILPHGRTLPKLVAVRAAVGEPFTLGGPVEGVIPRSKIREATEKARVKLQAVIDLLEPRT